MVNMKQLFTIVAITIAIVATVERFFWVIAVVALYAAGQLWGGKVFEYIGVKIDRKTNDGCQNNLKNTTACKVCSGNNCNRHKPSVYNTQVNVPKNFDTALQNFLEHVLQTYVCTWYTNFSSDDAFLRQLRLTTSIAVRNLIGRLLSANTSEVIFNNLVPLAMQHAQDWRELSRRAREKGANLEDYTLDYFGSTVHPAARSRQSEINYLRRLVTGLLPHLLPSIYISTNNKVILREILANWVLLPAVDALADPDNINFLIKLCTQYEGVLVQEIDSVTVPVLQSWVTPIIAVEEDPLKPSLDQVLNDPQLLYLFMQHIKETGPVNLLQFCLDIDDLSKRMLNPEMTRELEENLYTDAQTIYSTYLDPQSIDYLHLPQHISHGIRDILAGGPSHVQDLRTSRPLYQAHQESHALLEAVCLPTFHHSFELYKLLCGAPASSVFVKASGLSLPGSGGVGARLTTQISKIRGVLRAATVDGAAFNAPDVFHADEMDCSSRTEMDVGLDKPNRDLTAWRVTVPHVDRGNNQALYMVAVDSVAENKSWTVLRREQDFYTLRAKLLEFHGDREISDSPLPARKSQHISLIANRQQYQDFLQRLLAKPTLRSSELLHTFLTEQNLKCFTSYTAPDIGVLYHNVAHKLRKEKGQHLDKFMNTFLASTNIDHESVNVGVDPINDHNFTDAAKRGRILRSGIFGNNLNIEEPQASPIASSKTQIKGACFCIAEAVENLLEAPLTVSTVIWIIASITHQRLNSVCNKFLNNTLEKLLSGGRAAMVVRLLQTTVFGSKTSRQLSTASQRDEDRFVSAREGLYSLMPWWFLGVRPSWCRLVDALLEPLQHAALNKHLAYNLIDQVVLTLFPEISLVPQVSTDSY